MPVKRFSNFKRFEQLQDDQLVQSFVVVVIVVVIAAFFFFFPTKGCGPHL